MNRPMIHLKNCFLFLAKRNYTCIVERLEKAPLAKKGVDVRKIKLTSNHYHYKLVDCLHTKKWGNMNLILTQYVEGNFVKLKLLGSYLKLNYFLKGVGNKGEFVSVSRHMAHYELLPAQLAVFPTEENIEFYKEDAALLKDKPKVSKYAAYARDHINKMVLEIQMNTSAKWTLNKDHIRIALRNKVLIIYFNKNRLTPKKKIKKGNNGYKRFY